MSGMTGNGVRYHFGEPNNSRAGLQDDARSKQTPSNYYYYYYYYYYLSLIHI